MTHRKPTEHNPFIPNPPTRTEYPPLWVALTFVILTALVVAGCLWVIAQ